MLAYLFPQEKHKQSNRRGKGILSIQNILCAHMG